MTASIVVWQDIACPWATIALTRLRRARDRRGVAGSVVVELRAFPLELINERPTPKSVLDAEIPVAGALEPDFGWRLWQRRPWEWPVTTLPALEAVYAAADQSRQVAEDLDMALRKAFFCDSRTVSLHHEIVGVARGVADLDVDKLRRDLMSGRFRDRLFQDFEIARSETVEGSPHLFLPDGTSEANPGIELHWEGEHGKGFPIVDKDDPGIYETLLARVIEEEDN